MVFFRGVNAGIWETTTFYSWRQNTGRTGYDTVKFVTAYTKFDEFAVKKQDGGQEQSTTEVKLGMAFFNRFLKTKQDLSDEKSQNKAAVPFATLPDTPGQRCKSTTDEQNVIVSDQNMERFLIIIF